MSLDDKLYKIRNSQQGSYLMCIIGTIMFAVGVKVFVKPVDLYNGGAMGISQIIDTLLTRNAGIQTSFDLTGIIYLLINIPLLCIAFKSLGRRFFIKTIICVILSSLLLSIIPTPELPIMEDTLSNTLIAGIVAGAGSGFILKSGGSAGGLDILGVYFTKKYKDFSVGRISVTVNFFIYFICIWLFDISTAIYSIIYATFTSFVVDKMFAQTITVETMIMTKSDGKAISDYIIKEFQRGVTVWDATGAYTGEPTKILYAVLSKYEAGILKRALNEMDPGAFVVLKEGGSISGQFKRHI